MIIGIPRETAENEFRVAMTPGGVRELASDDHIVLVEKDAGIGSLISNDDYLAAGATMAERAEVYERSHMIIKVQAPSDYEMGLLVEGQVVLAFLHLATSPATAKGLMGKRVTALAYETVQQDDGKLPILRPMSEIAGRMAPQIGANLLEKVHGGRGVLLGAVSGVMPAKVLVLGAGMVGTNAARMASGLEADVTVMDIDLDRLRHLDDLLFGRIKTLASQSLMIEEMVPNADLLIGAVLRPGAISPVLVSEETVKRMKPGAVIVDIAIDQGGCVETSEPTNHASPVIEKHGVLHYGVQNIAGAVPRTSTFALTSASLPYIIRLANKGLWQALKEDPALAAGANIVDGKVTSVPVAAALDEEYYALDTLIPFEIF